MAHWIFKLTDQEIYEEEMGKSYVFDNRHSVKVQAGDTFLYLDKRQKYSFTATGSVARMTRRKPTQVEATRAPKIREVITAHLKDMVWFSDPLPLNNSNTGRKNRAQLGVSDLNRIGWSISVRQISPEMYKAIMDLAHANQILPTISPSDYSVPDEWSEVRKRSALSGFKKDVLSRHTGTCAVCGTNMKAVLDAAHLSPYAVDIENRANPANGICLCSFCHHALDRRLIAIRPDGELLVSSSLCDQVALMHFQRVASEIRSKWIRGIDPVFLTLTVNLFKEAAA